MGGVFQEVVCFYNDCKLGMNRFMRGHSLFVENAKKINKITSSQSGYHMIVALCFLQVKVIIGNLKSWTSFYRLSFTDVLGLFLGF